LKPLQWPALALALSGIGVVAAHVGGDVSVTGLLLVLAAALCWSLGNMVQRAAGQVDMLGFIIWSSPFALVPLLGACLLLEGETAIRAGLAAMTTGTWVAVGWQAVGSTLFGYGAWGWLLVRYPAASVAPTSLLVPVFGMTATAIFLGEELPAWKLEAAAMIIGGLALNLVASRQPARSQPGRR